MSASVEMHRWCGHPDCDEHISVRIHVPDYDAVLTVENMLYSRAEAMADMVIKALNNHTRLMLALNGMIRLVENRETREGAIVREALAVLKDCKAFTDDTDDDYAHHAITGE